MKDKKKFLLILGIGALGLYAFYRYRRGLPIIPSLGGVLAGQGTAGSAGSQNGAFGGQTSLPQVPAQPFTETERIRLRNLGTGPQSRGQCLIQNGCRWIDTQTAPYYGLGVSQAIFTKWINGGFGPFPNDSQPTLEYVRAALKI